MISKHVQQWATIETISFAGFSATGVWMTYVSIGGNYDQFDVTGYLAGILDLPTLDRDLVAHAVNEMILESDLPIDGARYSADVVAGGSGFANIIRTLSSPETDQLGHPAPTDAIDAIDAVSTTDDGYAARADQPCVGDEAEHRRNQALAETGLLAAGPEERFDRITAETREHFGVSWAFIVLIPEDCHVIKSVTGPDEQDLPWVYDLCARTIEADRTLAVADAAASPEFSDDLSTSDIPEVRFYAGHPICTAEGWRIGTLCLVDDLPRSFSEAEERELRIRAARVEIETLT